MATTPTPAPAGKDAAKAVDLPPYGPRNPDPITGAPGSHPIETGIGAAIGGAAGGLAVGAVGGPVGAVVGAIVGGAAAGGLAGKGIGELIDPTTEDNWLRNYFGGGSGATTEQELAAHRRAFRYGLAARSRFPGQTFRDVEDELRQGWDGSGETVPWAAVCDSTQAGFEQALRLPMDAAEVRSRH